MSSLLTVEGIGKRYGVHRALQSVSFSAEKGEVIALLGKNGAGKSTLMNLMTGYLAPTEGVIRVAGFDVLDQAMQARRHVGYLPEVPPLYPDMTAEEYLRWCAGLKRIPGDQRKKEADRVIEATGLSAYRARLSGRLSKGYRQRLGLAQALLGSPEVLILDEPGSGLDPVQLTQMRDILKGLGEHSAVILSSHILSEVTGICTRALVLDQGALRYDGPMERITRQKGVIDLAYRGPEDMRDKLAALPGVRAVTGDGERLSVRFDPQIDLRPLIFHAFEGSGAELMEMTPRQESLEDAFLRLTEGEVEEA